MYDDIINFVMLLQAKGNAVPSNPKHALECLMQFGRDVFPTLCIAYRLLLTIGFSIPSCEKSFSKVKIDKNMSKIIYATGTPNKLGFNQHKKRIPFSRCEK